MEDRMTTKNETTEKTDETADNAPAAKLRVVEKKVNQIITVLEKLFGIDIDRDGKIGAARVFATVALFALLTIIGIGVALAADNIIKYPTLAGGTALTLDTDGVLTVGSNVVIGGNCTVTGTNTAAVASFSTTGNVSISGYGYITGALWQAATSSANLGITTGATFTTTGRISGAVAGFSGAVTNASTLVVTGAATLYDIPVLTNLSMAGTVGWSGSVTNFGTNMLAGALACTSVFKYAHGTLTNYYTNGVAITAF